MAQAVATYGSEGEKELDLKSHLAKFNVPDRVYGLLAEESITVAELTTFRTRDLDTWADEHELKTIERRRFINAVKALPNADANKPIKPQIVKVYLGKEEKEQMQKFSEMETNVNKLITNVNEMTNENKSNVENVIKDIDSVCNQMQVFVENLRQKLLKQVKSLDADRGNNLDASLKSFEKLLTLVKTTRGTYDEYLSNLSNVDISTNDDNNNKNTARRSEKEIKQEVDKCKSEYEKTMAQNLKIVSDNSTTYALNYKLDEIKSVMNEKLLTINIEHKELNPKIKQLNLNRLYSICVFDETYTKLSQGSSIKLKNQHIKIGPNNTNSYTMITPDEEHSNGYRYGSGKHCWRMYFNEAASKWLFLGIYKYGVVPSNCNVYSHANCWGYQGDTICLNGAYISVNKSILSYVKSENENGYTFDMFADFDSGTMSFKAVDDIRAPYKVDKKFDTQICYTITVCAYYANTEVQVAEISPDMFGKNKKLVKWPKKY